MKFDRRCSLLAGLLLACILCTAVADQSEHPQPLPAELVQAWKQVRAEVGWISTSDDGQPKFRRAGDEPEDWSLVLPIPVQPPPRVLPEFEAFHVPEWKPGALARLPQPPQAFGLYLTRRGNSDSVSIDAGLKDLVGMKNLQVLVLHDTLERVTDAGLQELAGLENLQMLDLRGCVNVTDVGLKSLARLKNLRCLNLANARWQTQG